MGGGIVISLIIAWLTPFIKNVLPHNLEKLYSMTIFPYLWMFLIAALTSEYYELIVPILKKYWWLFMAILIIKSIFPFWDIRLHLYQCLGTVLSFCAFVGFAYSFPQINIKTDISYGVYIYHMTVLNALIALGYMGNSWTLLVVISVTCLLAWISTVTIGKISNLKKLS